MHTLQQIDKEAIVKAVRETKAIVTVENYNVQGGMGSIVADVLIQSEVPTKFTKIGIPDEFVAFGYLEKIHPHYRLDPHGVTKTVKEFLQI